MTQLPILSLIQLLGGLLLLIIGAELLVRAAVRLAASVRVRPLLIGLTIVAFGSSAPQMAVSLQAAFQENADIAVGSVIGGNIFNTLVTLGLSALIIPLRVSRQLVRLDIPLMIVASLLIFGLAFNEELGRLDGMLMLLIFALYLGLLLRTSQNGQTPHIQAPQTHRRRAPWVSSVFWMLLGLALLTLAGRLLLDAAVEVATELGLSETDHRPDRGCGRHLAAPVGHVADRRPARSTGYRCRQRDRRQPVQPAGGTRSDRTDRPRAALGNALSFDLPVMLGVALLCWPVFYSGYRITRAEGLLFLGLYLAYGLHVVWFTTGMPMAVRLEHLMLFFVLPALGAYLLFSTLRAWRRQHS